MQGVNSGYVIELSSRDKLEILSYCYDDEGRSSFSRQELA